VILEMFIRCYWYCCCSQNSYELLRGWSD